MNKTAPKNIVNTFSYDSYRKLVFDMADNNGSTGEITEEHISATKINAQWIKRIDKQAIVREDIKKAVGSLKSKWNWIVIIESWCGDGAQNLPFIAKIAEQSENINLKIILRDENPEIIDAYLTNGSRSVPKLICCDAETDIELGIWGPRPEAIQKMVTEFKSNNPNVPHDEFIKNVHLWYSQDKGESFQEEFHKLITDWINK